MDGGWDGDGGWGNSCVIERRAIFDVSAKMAGSTTVIGDKRRRSGKNGGKQWSAPTAGGVPAKTFNTPTHSAR